MSTDIDRAIVRSLRLAWRDEEVGAVPGGRRLYLRWTDESASAPGWDDWRWWGEVDADGRITWQEDAADWWLATRVAADVRAATAEGRSSGRLVGWPVEVQWCRHELDGPAVRVADWAKEEPS